MVSWWFMPLFYICVVFTFLFIFGSITMLLTFRYEIKGWWYRRRNFACYVESVILNDNEQQMRSHQFIDENSGFEIGADRYIVDRKCLVYRKNVPKIYHFKGNPNPIDWKTHNINIDISSDNYKLLIKQKLIRDLLGENNLLMIILLVGIVSCVIGVAIAVKVYGLLDKATEPAKKV